MYLFFTQFKKGYHHITYPTPTLIPSILFIKKPYTTTFTDIQRITLGSNICSQWGQCSTKKLTTTEKSNENYDCNKL